MYVTFKCDPFLFSKSFYEARHFSGTGLEGSLRNTGLLTMKEKNMLFSGRILRIPGSIIWGMKTFFP